MFVSKKSLSRRTVLRGAGTAIALPLLDAMLPAFVPLAKADSKPRTRFGAVYFPNGAIMQQLTPKTVGPGFEFTPILKPLEPFKDKLIVVTNLTRSHPGSQFGDHAVSAAGFLTGVWPKRTEAEDVHANTTIDQVVAEQIGQDTPLPSLEVATEDFTGYVGGCSPGFSCAYLNTISWSSPTTPLPMEINPREVFERLFGVAGTPAQREARMHKERSILDSVTEETSGLEHGLSPRDRVRMTDYLDNLREIERRIQKQEARGATQVDTPDAPVGIPDSFDEHVAILFDLLAVAYQADITRVFTFMMSRELSQRTYPQIGVTEQHHSVSHHQNNPVKMAQCVKINTYHVGLYAKFLEKLRSTPDGDGSLLDHSLILYGAGMADSNVHATDPLPVIAVGGGVGAGHRHIELPKRTPVGNFWRNVAGKFGKPMEHFGDSTGSTDVLV
ncbi:MAG TPA: DUF1552 domain-containing protein [Bryobacteraceae bacterium]|nr:DUF1552 domain-containing protein [Bryobacteraceae bacterium]